jgi:hypothetical protein
MQDIQEINLKRPPFPQVPENHAAEAHSFAARERRLFNVTTFGETCSIEQSVMDGGWNYLNIDIPDIQYRDGDYMVEILHAVIHDNAGVFYPTLTVEVEGLCRDAYHHAGPAEPTFGGMPNTVGRIASSNRTLFRVPLGPGNKPAPSRIIPGGPLGAQPAEDDPRAIFYGRDITKFHLGKIVAGMSPAGMFRWRVPIPWYLDAQDVPQTPYPMRVDLEFQFYPNSFK